MVMLAREAKGFSQTRLAKLLKMSQPTLSKVESGESALSDELVARLAEVLDVPTSLFFEKLDFRQLPLAFYRRKVNVKSGTLKAIRARTNFERMRVRRLLQTAAIPELRALRVDPRKSPNAPIEAARRLRLHWNLPPGPIPHLARVIEDAGILLVPFDFGSEKVDALSLYDPNDGLPPIIFYNPEAPGDRMRLTVAHELGHVIMHHHLAIPDEDADTEQEAFLFAAEFLMPADDIRGHFQNLNLQRLAALKPHWRVSMSAMIMHAHRLDRLTDRQKTYLFSQMSRLGYRTREPVDVPKEKPALLGELLDYHLGDLELSENDLRSVLHFADPFQFRRYLSEVTAAA